MNDDDPAQELEQLRAAHRELDRRIEELVASGGGDQIEVARLKKRKLLFKDQIQLLLDRSTPDIIA